MKLLQKLQEKKARDKAVQQHLRVFGFRYLPHYFTEAPSQLHNYLFGRLEGYESQPRGQKDGTIAPRGSAKTTIVSKTYPIFAAVTGREKYILLVGDTASQSRQNLEAVREELEKNERLAEDFPHAFGEGPVWTQDRLITRNGVTIECIGSGAKIRGRTRRENRPTLIIIDDLQNDESVESPSQRKKDWEWFKRALVPAGTKKTNYFVVGTALHREDVLQNLSRTPGWNVRTFRSITKEPSRLDLWDRWTAIYTNLLLSPKEREEAALKFYIDNRMYMEKDAEVLWPEVEDLYYLMKYKLEIGTAAFESEKQGNPVSPWMTEWPSAYFEGDIWFDNWPETRLRVLSGDPSKGETEKADYSAWVSIGLGTDGFLYVDADLERRDTTKYVEDGIDIMLQTKPHAVPIEANQFQILLKNEFDAICKKRKLVAPTLAVTNTERKNTRIRTLSPLITSRKIKYRRNSPGVKLLLQQLQDFPTGDHDDGPDALEIGVRTLQWLQDGTKL